MDLKEIIWNDMDWINLAEDRDQSRTVVNTVMNLGGSIKCWEILEYLSDCWLLKKDRAALS
jgi:hypothetical protein